MRLRDVVNTPSELGIPPIWSPPGIAPHLRPDSGIRYVDQNTDRNPWSPLEPLIRAVVTMHPNFSFDTIDVMTDRRPIRKLFAFVSGDAEYFEFGVEVIGTTALFVRMEKQTRDEIPPGAFQGYRRAFEEEYTKLSISAKGSTSHHRVIHYNFGGLQFLVRSAVDAYVEDLTKTPEAPKASDKHKGDDLIKYMKAASLGNAAPSIVDRPEAPGLTVVHGGRNIPHAAVLELKTCFKFAKKPFELQQKMPDLWISQTPNFVEAAHQNVGTKWSRKKDGQPRLAEFVKHEVKPMREELINWEDANATTLRKLLAVLRQVVEAAKAINAPCIVSYQREEAALWVTKAGRGMIPSMPEDLHKKWSVVAKSA